MSSLGIPKRDRRELIDVSIVVAGMLYSILYTEACRGGRVW